MMLAADFSIARYACRDFSLPSSVRHWHHLEVMIEWRRWFVLIDTELGRRSLGQKPIDVIVGERLAALRSTRGVSLDLLGSVLGITGQEVADYEAGAVRIPPAQLIQICKFFQVTLQSLFPRLDRDHDPNLH